MDKARGMTAINNTLSTYAGQRATLAELMLCFKASAALRRVWKQARSTMGQPPVKLPRKRLLQPPLAQHPAERPEQPQPAPALLPEQPAQRPEPPAEPAQPKWSETQKFGSGTWG